MRTIQVVKVKGGTLDGKFAVQMLMREPGEDMWEVVTHAARFHSKEQAERLAQRVRAADPGDRFDFAGHWTWNVSMASPYAFMQQQPTASPYPICSTCSHPAGFEYDDGRPTCGACMER